MAEYTCPHCKKQIDDDDALLCYYCGESLRRGIGLIAKMKRAPFESFFICLIALIIISFFAAMVLH